MSNPRNTLRSPLSRRRVRALAALGCAGAGVLAACSTDPATAPAGPGARPAAAMSAADSVEEFVRDSVRQADKATRDSVEDARDAAKAAARVQKNLAKAQLDSLKKDWEKYKQAVKRGGVKVEALRCEPQPRAGETKVIGPKGGVIKMGLSQLVIPPGALDTNVTITGTAPTSSAVEVQFQPHGLLFKRSVEMTIDYGKCVVPDTTELDVTYTLNGWWGVERMPSADARRDKRITALTDHFSGYVLTIGRR